MVHVTWILEHIKEAEDNPATALLAAYKALYGDDFDTLPTPIPFGRANRETNKKIMDALMDKFPNQRTGIGMLWVNKGFSMDPSVPTNIVWRGDE